MGLASAAAVHHKSTISIDYSNTGSGSVELFGKVKSSAERCVKARKVQVLRGKTVSQVVIKAVTTDHHGKWSLTLQAPKPGPYQAKAVRQTFSRHGQQHVCKPARSPKIDIN